MSEFKKFGGETGGFGAPVSHETRPERHEVLRLGELGAIAGERPERLGRLDDSSDKREEPDSPSPEPREALGRPDARITQHQVEQIRRKLSDIERICNEVRELVPSAEDAEGAFDAQAYCAEKLDLLVDENTPMEDRQHIACYSMLLFQSEMTKLELRVSSLERELGVNVSNPPNVDGSMPGNPTTANLFTRSLSRLIEFLKQGYEWLHKLICGMFRPKEWTMKVNVPLFGGTGIDVKFGP